MITDHKEVRRFLELLLLLFIGLKLSGFINWSWWWVMSPLWTPILTALFFATIIVFYEQSKKKE